ncbi:MAG: capsule biosynthesis protein CapA [Pseudomonadota bacterium]
MKPALAKSYLFLQGPHGPFFWQLAKMVRSAGASVTKIGFNAGDRFFWREKRSYTRFSGTLAEWPETCAAILTEHAITDIVLYGDAREIHAQAIKIAKARGITVHVFEEGYLRPYWITYERDGANGHSKLMDLSVAHMEAALSSGAADVPRPPAEWGDMHAHIFYGAVYHWFVWFWNRAYPGFQPHRALTVRQEFLLYLRRLLYLPVHVVERRLATSRIRRGGYPYHLVLLQLSHDANFLAHSTFDTIEDFVHLALEGFAEGAPAHHHLVFKAHPLENGAKPLRRIIRQHAERLGITHRVHYVRGGKLARLLTDTRSAVTVNSTAAQQVLWRGLPLKAFGQAVYRKSAFVSDQTLPAFFRAPERPDQQAYEIYRKFLLASSQLSGGYYSAKGRKQVLRQVVDMMLSPQDPYDAAQGTTAALQQQLRLVKD